MRSERWQLHALKGGLSDLSNTIRFPQLRRVVSKAFLAGLKNFIEFSSKAAAFHASYP